MSPSRRRRTSERRGPPARLSDSAAHRIVGGPATAAGNAWAFERDGAKETIDLEPHAIFSDNKGAIAAAVAGLGITSTTQWSCCRDIGCGSLVRVLAPWTMSDIAVQAYFPMGRGTRAAARAFIDFLVEDLKTDQPRASNAGIDAGRA